MQLTKHTDYAFRVLIYLASMKAEMTTIQHIADDFSISKSHLMKIVNKLVDKGWIQAIRGKNGGIYLGQPAEEISLRDIVETMEQTLEPANCSNPVCAIIKSCKLKHILWDAQSRYLEHLEAFTLADLLNRETAKLLKIV